MHTMLQMHLGRLIFISIIANFSVKNINASAEVIGRRAGPGSRDTWPQLNPYIILSGRWTVCFGLHWLWFRTSAPCETPSVPDGKGDGGRSFAWLRAANELGCADLCSLAHLLTCTSILTKSFYYLHKKMCMHPTQGYMTDLESSTPRGTLLSMW